MLQKKWHLQLYFIGERGKFAVAVNVILIFTRFPTIKPQFDFFYVGTPCCYPSIRLGLKGNRSCYTSAKATATQSITIVC